MGLESRHSKPQGGRLVCFLRSVGLKTFALYAKRQIMYSICHESVGLENLHSYITRVDFPTPTQLFLPKISAKSEIP